ncbi:MAG: HlyD family secretion protein [Myxococcota bacterium]
MVAATLAIGALSGCSSARAEEGERFQGTVELEERSVGFEVSGRLASVLVREGDVVAAGAVLARVDDAVDRSARAARESEAVVAKSQATAVKAGARGEELRSLAARVNAAKASEELFQKQLARQEQLFASGAVPAASVDDLRGALARASAERESLEHTLQLTRQGARREDVSVAEARARSAEAAVALDDERLRRHELRAPIAATVLDVNFEVGEVVAAGAPIVTLADTHAPYVDVFVPQAQISAVSVGEAARVRVDALNQELGGRVEHIARRTEFTPRYLFSERERPNLVVRVRVRVDDPGEKLRAGVPAFVRLVDGGSAPAVNAASTEKR